MNLPAIHTLCEAATQLCNRAMPTPTCGEDCEHFECSYVVACERWNYQFALTAGPMLESLAADVPQLLARLAAAEKERDAAIREADRWRHGVTIEGDYVCPSDLARDRAMDLVREVEAERDALRLLLAEACNLAFEHVAVARSHSWKRTTRDRISAIQREGKVGE